MKKQNLTLEKQSDCWRLFRCLLLLALVWFWSMVVLSDLCSSVFHSVHNMPLSVGHAVRTDTSISVAWIRDQCQYRAKTPVSIAETISNGVLPVVEIWSTNQPVSAVKPVSSNCVVS